MSEIFKALFIIFWVVMIVIAGMTSFMFSQLFNKLKQQAPDYLDSHIKKYSSVSAKTQISRAIFFGRYNNVHDSSLLIDFHNVRAMMFFSLFVTTVAITLLLIYFIMAHH